MNEIIQKTEENQRLMLEKDKCDKFDYLISVACGVIGGLIDIIFVGAAVDSPLGKDVDKVSEKIVKSVAEKLGWKPRTGNEDSVSAAVDWLEKKYIVNYDQDSTKAVGGKVQLSTDNHHYKSVGHSPDLLGLIYSILDQFRGTSTFFENGKKITVNSYTQNLEGNDFVSKLYCGFVNWLGHLFSDFIGASGTIRKGGRGQGIVIPFYELFGLCDFGRFKDGNVRRTLAEIAEVSYVKGYDFRFGMAQAIPVVITNLVIKLVWSFRRFFCMRKNLSDCIPTNSHSDLRVMLIIGNGTLCIMDGMDAAIRSGGNFLAFFMRFNMIAWLKFLKLVIKEVCIRIGLENDLSLQLEAMKRVDEALVKYLDELKDYDIAGYEIETSNYNAFVEKMNLADTQEELSSLLLETYEQMGFELPWKGDFDEFMSDSSNQLIFD